MNKNIIEIFANHLDFLSQYAILVISEVSL